MYRARQRNRILVNWPAVALCGDRRSGCTILDITYAGARIRLPGPIADGSSIDLVSPAFGVIEGRVVWTKGEMAGVRFSEPPLRVERKLKPLLAGAEMVAAQAPGGRPVFGRRK